MFLPILLILFLFLVDFGLYVIANSQTQDLVDFASDAGGVEFNNIVFEALKKKYPGGFSDYSVAIDGLNDADRIDILSPDNFIKVENKIKENFNLNLTNFKLNSNNPPILSINFPPAINCSTTKNLTFKTSVTKNQEFNFVKGFLNLNAVDIKAEALASLRLCP
jgi:hypothetical protein